MDLPKQIYVHVEGDGDDQYLSATEDIVSIDDLVTVGIYELRQVKKKAITHELV